MLASEPRSPLTAYVFVLVLAAVASLITWRFGLVVRGLLAREVAAEFARRNTGVRSPMLVAFRFVVWHMGYSGSGPLTAATAGSFIENQLGHTVPVSETSFSWWNITAAVATVVLVALDLWLVAPRVVPGSHRVTAEALAQSEQDIPDHAVEAPLDHLDASRIPILFAGLALVAHLVVHLTGGSTVTLDISTPRPVWAWIPP